MKKKNMNLLKRHFSKRKYFSLWVNNLHHIQLRKYGNIRNQKKNTIKPRLGTSSCTYERTNTPHTWTLRYIKALHWIFHAVTPLSLRCSIDQNEKWKQKLHITRTHFLVKKCSCIITSMNTCTNIRNHLGTQTNKKVAIFFACVLSSFADGSNLVLISLPLTACHRLMLFTSETGRSGGDPHPPWRGACGIPGRVESGWWPSRTRSSIAGRWR